MAWHSLAPLLAALLIWTSTTGGQFTQEYRITNMTENSRTATSKGRSFIVAFTENLLTPATLALQLSSYDEPCMVQVTVPSPPYNQTVLLAKNSTSEVVLPSNYMLTAGERSRKLVTVSSDADISVIAFNTASASADAFTCLSKQDLGTEYFVFTAVSVYGNYFAVGNGEDVETQVNITVSGTLLVDGTRYEDKQMVTITLAPQEVILLSDANDLTGTRLASSTPVAVFSGSACYNSPSSYCDTIIEQLYPVRSWGQQFVVFPLMTKEVRDRIIIIAARPNTTVTLRNESTTLQYSLQLGSHVSMDLQTGMLVNATEPIMVGYLFQGGSTLELDYDPFIVTVPPSNFPWRYYKFVTNAFFYNSLFIVSRSSSSSSDFLLDYRPLSDYVPTVQHLEGFTGWEVNLGKIGGQHEISHRSETFGIYVYGVEYITSYGYSLGQAESFSGVPQCNPACADNELCTNCAGYAECKCQRGKYTNASCSDIVPTVQCEGSAMTMSLNKCLLERFRYSLTQMHFADANCTVTTLLLVVGNERMVQVKAIPQAGWCGNEMKIHNDKTMTLSNVLYIPPDNSSGIIVSSLLMFTFSCTYNMTMQTSLLTALHPIIGISTLPSVNGSGPTTATMAAFKSNFFTDPLTEDDTLTVGTPLYIGILTTFPDGDKFTLRAERCVAAPSNNPADPSVELIAGGCAVTQDVNVHMIQNGQSLQVMFEIETFIFKDQSKVYMKCDVSLCPITPSNTCQLLKQGPFNEKEMVLKWMTVEAAAC